MALSKRSLQENIEAAFEAVAATAKEGSGDQSQKIIKHLARDLAKAIHEYVLSADIIVKSVSGVTSGPSVSGPGTGNLA